MGALGLEVFLGFLTFTGSLMAFGKLQGLITGAPVTWKGQNASNITMFCAALVLLVCCVIATPAAAILFYAWGRSACWSACWRCCRSAAPTCRW